MYWSDNNKINAGRVFVNIKCFLYLQRIILILFFCFFVYVCQSHANHSPCVKNEKNILLYALTSKTTYWTKKLKIHTKHTHLGLMVVWEKAMPHSLVKNVPIPKKYWLFFSAIEPRNAGILPWYKKCSLKRKKKK
jgi:hypothetical protein